MTQVGTVLLKLVVLAGVFSSVRDCLQRLWTCAARAIVSRSPSPAGPVSGSRCPGTVCLGPGPCRWTSSFGVVVEKVWVQRDSEPDQQRRRVLDALRVERVDCEREADRHCALERRPDHHPQADRERLIPVSPSPRPRLLRLLRLIWNGSSSSSCRTAARRHSESRTHSGSTSSSSLNSDVLRARETAGTYPHHQPR